MDKKYNHDSSINVSGESTAEYTQMSMTDYKYLGPR
jgi:hypothetical protein